LLLLVKKPIFLQKTNSVYNSMLYFVIMFVVNIMNTYNEIKERLLDYAYHNNIPMVGEFELTGHCNFSCEMCYAKSNTQDLTTEEWINIFNQAQTHGMLYALLTGGEIFSRPDFVYLYEYLFDLGIKITLYTNGSMLPNSVLEALTKRPPELIAITLYGHDEPSYKAFTKSNSFSDVSKNIDLLKSKNLNVVLRTIPLPIIYKELDKIISFAKEKKLHLGHFLYVSKSNPQMKRLNAKQLLDFELRIKKAFPTKSKTTKAERCGAFKTGFFINHIGVMQGCAMMPKPSRKIDNNFKEVYDKLQKQWNALVEQSPCKDCSIKNNCFTCLANRYLEGNMFACSDYLKDFAKESSI